MTRVEIERKMLRTGKSLRSAHRRMLKLRQAAMEVRAFDLVDDLAKAGDLVWDGYEALDTHIAMRSPARVG